MNDVAETRYPETPEEETIAACLRASRGPDLTADVVDRAVQRANIMRRIPTHQAAVDLLMMAEDKIHVLERKVDAARDFAKWLHEEDWERSEAVDGAWSLLEELGR